MRVFICLVLYSICLPSSFASPIVRVQLTVEPRTHSFSCRYTFSLPASDTTSSVRLNLNRQFPLQHLVSSHAIQQRVVRRYYPAFADTMQQVQVRFPATLRKRRTVTFTYAGTLDKGLTTDQVMIFSGHSNWLPFRPYQEYELVTYTLAVSVPPAYQVRSTTPAKQPRAGRWVYQGTTSAIELTAFVAQQFYQTVSATAPPITLVKTGAPLARPDTAVLRQAEAITAFYNRTLGRQDPIAHFTIFLPGTNYEAYGLRANATVVTYSDFDVTKPGDLLILAHEISHKWWAYGSFHTENGWLSEAFATYSSLLYLQASGDEAGYQQELTRLTQSAAGTPPLWGFDRTKYEPAMYRRVIYNKGTVVLAALRARMGNEPFITLLAKTAAQQTSTTKEFLQLVQQVAGPQTSAWLLEELKR
jgi:hypothetical protein